MNPLLDSNAQNGLRQIDIVKIYNEKQCLVVDDFPEIRGSLTRMLKAFGAKHIDTAANGDEAITFCFNTKYDIVLCDYNLGPGKDGQQVLEEVRFTQTVPMTSLFVMITAEASSEMVLGALESQPDDYITKPFTQASLKIRLDKALIRHIAMLDIKKAIAQKDYRNALDLCDEAIKQGSRYSLDCLKIKGQLLLITKQAEKAKAIYQQVLKKKPAMWAKLGMGKALLAASETDAAVIIFKEIIDQDSRYIEAHDYLGEIYSSQHKPVDAQTAILTGTRISPKSVLRHRRLAEMAELNQDDDIALKSFQHSIRWGLNSCHESEQDYFNYVRKAANVISDGPSKEASTIEKQAKTYLDRVRKRYQNHPETQVQALMTEAQLAIAKGSKSDANNLINTAVEAYDKLPLPSVDTSLEYARALYANGNETKAVEILSPLLEKYSSNKEIVVKIDGITSEPVSTGGKKIASSLAKEGIGKFEKKEFQSAINIFKSALGMYPKHVGLNLNLIQAIISLNETTKTEIFSDEHLKLCQYGLRAIGSISPDHRQYERYLLLSRQLKRYTSAAASR